MKSGENPRVPKGDYKRDRRLTTKKIMIKKCKNKCRNRKLLAIH